MINGTVTHEMDAFDQAMGQYIALSRRTPAEVVAQKGAQIIMGNMSPPFPGLYQSLRQLTPPEGTITQDRLGALASTGRGARRPVKVRRRSRVRAEAMLEGRASGLFSVTSNGGRMNVRQVRFRKKGDARISNRSNRGGVVRINRRSEGLSGEKLLNRISLAIAVELMIREQGRGYVAISFLPKKYRQMLGKARASVRRNLEAYRRRKVTMNQALREGAAPVQTEQLMKNAKGETLGRVFFSATAAGDGAALRITGFTPPQRQAEAHNMVGDVIHAVTADTRIYIDNKLRRNRADVGKFGK